MQLRHFQNEFPYLVKALLSAKKAGRLSHSFLIHNDDGKLADDFSISLAQALACTNPLPDGDSCGNCVVCKQLEHRTYSELFTLAPVSKSRQIVIGVDDTIPDTMRWFRSLFHMKSSMAGGIKIGIIYDADCMNDESQNCFLKTLEEPPPSSHVLLVTANPFTLLPTIRSRCQSILLLRNKTSYEDEKIRGIAGIMWELMSSSNKISTAEECAFAMISISDNLEKFAEEKADVKWDRIFEDSKYLEPPAKKRLEKQHEAAISAEYLKMRDSMLSLIHSWSAQAYMLSCGIPRDSIANPELFPRDLNVISSIDPEKAYRMMRKSEDLLQILNWNVDTDLAFREFCMGVEFGK
ncbi:MAG TPA: hypothetical protein DCZ94_00900 [Lentisphaeria bacterium]|nr:MAG: hypothetical protein A2X48_11870 [Lentisphaerae bacterium GWF2_49_21]HBC85488.1 hypothetical protein [Lentisphaeria bacterium]